MKNKKLSWIISSIIIALTILTTSAIWYLTSTVSVSGRLVDKNGKTYSNKNIKLGNIKTTTDHNGQFFIHVHRGIAYRIKNKNISFSIQAWSNNNINYSGKDLKLGMSVSTKDNKVSLSTRSNVAYLDNSYSVKYDEKSSTVTGRQYLSLKKGDKIVVMPTRNIPLGIAGKITKYSVNDGYFKAKITILQAEDVLKKLAIKSGQITSRQIVELNEQSNGNYNFEPTNFVVNAGFSNKISKKFSTKNIELNLEHQTKLDGNFNINAKFDFINTRNSKAKIIDQLKYSESFDADLTLKKEYLAEHTFHLTQFVVPSVPFVTIPVAFYCKGTANIHPKIEFAASTNIVSTFDGKSGIAINAKDSQASGELSISGKMSGELGAKAGIGLSAFPEDESDNLVEVNLKGGLELDGTAMAAASINANNQVNISGSYTGKGYFVTSAEATSPLLNNALSAKTGNSETELKVEKELSKNKLFDLTNTVKQKSKNTSKNKRSTNNSFNLDEIKSGDFSSAVGTWVNSEGDSITIDKNGLKEFDSSGNRYTTEKIYVEDGVVKSGNQEYNLTSKISNGFLKTQLGNDPLPSEPAGSPLVPMLFVPKGVPLSNVASTGFTDNRTAVDKIIVAQAVSDSTVFLKQTKNSKLDDKLPTLPKELTFSSGAGAWSNKITIYKDGYFTGTYSDYDATSVTKSNYVGQFSNIKKISSTQYTFKLASIKLQNSNETNDPDSGVPITWTNDVYGIDGGKSFRLYLPNEKISDLPNKFWTDNQGRDWNTEMKAQNNLNAYALLNEDMGYTFIGR